jgi:hypothetical protein
MYLTYYVADTFKHYLPSKLLSYFFFSENKYFYRRQNNLLFFYNINKDIECVALPYCPLAIKNNNKLGRRYKLDMSYVQIEIRNAYKIYVGNTNDQRHQENPENKGKILYATLEVLLDVSIKVTFVLEKAKKIQRGSRGIALLFL